MNTNLTICKDIINNEYKYPIQREFIQQKRGKNKQIDYQFFIN